MRTTIFAVFVMLAGCQGSVGEDLGDDDDDIVEGDAGPGGTDATPGQPDAEPPPGAPEIGTGDHTPDSVTFVQIAGPSDMEEAMDLEIDPASGDLWIVSQGTDSWTIVENMASATPSAREFYDNSNHFLRNPAGIAFSETDPSVTTCQENNNDWMGPTAWTTDRSIFQGGAQSHFDMGHESPNCTGIAWERDRIWWIFNGRNRSVDRYDFHGWHPDAPGGLGGEDHTDGEVWRFAKDQVARVPGVPSHMEYNSRDGYLYINDTGNGRIIRLKADTSSCSSASGRWNEMDFYSCSNTVEVVVAAGGDVELPAGMSLFNDILYVTDHATGMIYAFGLDGQLINWLDTGMGANALTGIEVSGAGQVYFINMAAERVYRIDP